MAANEQNCRKPNCKVLPVGGNIESEFRLKASVDCKTVRIFAYSSTREQSNKRSGTKLKTESETGV